MSAQGDEPVDARGDERSAPRRPTLKDIARAAGVSRSTAARALSKQGYVGAAAKTRVQAAAEELGYVPHGLARSLRQQVSRSVGVLVSDLRNPFYADLAAGISRHARARGYTMVLSDDSGRADVEREAARAFVAMRVAGVIVTPVSEEVSAFLLRQRVPVVEADRQFATGRCEAVIVDNMAASQRLSEHLISLGHRRIALLIDETDWTTGRERFRGYRESLLASGIPADPTLLVSAGSDVDAARKAAVDLLARRDRPTAVFAANNVLAEGLWRAAHDLGLRVPADLSLVSFDDAPWMSMVDPGVTAVAQDAVALGEAALDRLLTRIDNPEAPPVTVVIDAEIQARGSTAAPRES
ncbi:LacI family transcriptional regulator [Streptomyces tubbatahanensis]|uniref:LacI family transcriptional regulator n=1 Tax=Streptomyces tubbatahanensis TaxID=2923272 RepID=A0ABY3XM98_9ACTN|nr:LacI family DNA-binding transcriptional regulator [Streptomyces tubbatahanensis]UNS95524.1 LacI family transcriptional regulator [Streptomyces tubbatahanensis]